MSMSCIFRSKTISFMLGVYLLVTCISHADSVARCHRFYEGQSNHKIDLIQELRNLKRLLAQSNIYRSELENNPPKIVKIIEEVSNSGTTHRGVYRVVLEDDRRLVLKISTKASNINSILVPTNNNHLVSVDRKFNETLVLQNFLAERGISPQIHALYSQSHLVEIFSMLKKVNPFLIKKDLVDEDRIGILMDDMGDAWNGAGAAPINFKNPISKLVFKKKLTEIKEALKKYYLFISDQQIFLNQNGEVYLADLDFSAYVPGINPIYKMSVRDEANHFFDKIADQIPYGWFKKGQRLIKNKEEQQYLLLIWKMHKEGYTSLKIANILNQEAPRSNRGLRWISADIERILH